MEMECLVYFTDMINVLRTSLQRPNIIEEDEWKRCKDLTDESINELYALMTTTSLSRFERQKCQTCMAHLLSIQAQLESRPSGSKQGSGLEQRHGEKKVKWHDLDSAFQSRVKTGVIINISHKDINSFMRDAEILFQEKMSLALEEFDALKVNGELSAEYIIEKSNQDDDVSIKYFNTKNESVFQSTDLKEWFQINIRQPIERDMEEFEEKDSGWSLKSILHLTININSFNPLRGSSYIPLPDCIKRRNACINVKNDDNECFKWAVLSALYPASIHAERVQKYKQYENELNFKGIEFPVSFKQIKKFEKLNDISVNVLMLKKFGKNFEVTTGCVTSKKKVKHVNLLLIQDYYIDESKDSDDDVDEEFNSPKYHYVWVKDLSRLIRSQISKHKSKTYFCDRCLHCFWSEDKLIQHEMDCEKINDCKIKLPSNEEKTLKFENFERKECVPYVIYADIESLLKPVENGRAFQEHQAYSIGYYLKCSFDDARSEYKFYRQKNEEQLTPAEWFVKELDALSIELAVIHKQPVSMRLTDQEMIAYVRATTCHICKKPIEDDSQKVRDHSHLTGQFRGAAHSKCNLNYKDSRFIPVIFHNLTGYDSHFIIKDIATAADFRGRVQLIAENKERYISFIKHIDGSNINFRFIDSFRFMASSLDKLSSYLKYLNIVQKTFEEEGYSLHQIQLLKRKGVFPYDYVSSFESLEQMRLPPKEGFYSKLTEENISDEDYEHALQVWDAFNMKTLGEYSDLYLKTDVLLLADVFENFRLTCIKAYGLDPAHYYTTPGLTWDAMLKLTKVELELLTDIDMLNFIEKGIRGGISQCSNRYAKANNKYMKNNFNEKKEIKYLMYYDVNNLYGWAMTQSLPYAEFKWIEKDINNINFLSIPDDDQFGYILEVDLEYPDEIHDTHKDIPLCPEHLIPPGSKQKKLLTTLYDKQRYVIHYRALKQACRYGLRLTKIHRALRFKQKPWLKPYVDLNTQKRQAASNEFEKLFYKLMINAVYGKTMENERKRVDVKLVTKWYGRYSAEALISKPNFHSRSIFDENLMAVQLARTEMVIKKPLYIGLSVLDLSKVCLYDFHYAYMRQRFGDKCKVLYGDTDSLIYEISDVDVYEIMKEDIHRFDTSDYSENNDFGMPRVNKKVLGLMKDECCGNIMIEFIGLRSKMYSLRIQGRNPVQKLKGVKVSVVKKSISFGDYRSCLFESIIIKRDQCIIRPRLHVVRTERQTKVALSPHDDKRYLMPGKTDTLPWGHYSLRKGVVEIVDMKDGEVSIEEGEAPAQVGAAFARAGEQAVVGEGLDIQAAERAGVIRSSSEPENGAPSNKIPRRL